MRSHSTREYGSFLNIAFGSAAEARYLLQLSSRLHLVADEGCQEVDAAYHDLLCALQKLRQAVSRLP
jgi:four helix bundle protein